MNSIKNRTISAALWNLSGAGARTVTQFGISVMLARLLSPHDFGLFAMILMFPALGRIFIESGFGIALIHNKNATREEESTVFFCNLGLALVVYTVLWFLAPTIAGFYQQSSLVNIIRYATIGLLFDACGMVQGSVMARQLNFRVLAKISFSATLLSGCGAIVMAWNGLGVYALVWQGVMASLINSLLLWAVSSWRPVNLHALVPINRMAAYGSKMLISNLISVLFDNISSVLIGRFYSPADLGFYSRAQTTQGIPINTFSSAIGQVMVPSLVHINNKPDEFRRAYRRAMQAVVAISAPVMAAAIVLAEPLFSFIFTDKWLPAVPYFQVICIAGILYPLHLLNINILLSLGRPDLYLRLEIIKRILSLSISLYAIQFGIMNFAITITFLSFLVFPLNTYYTEKLAHFSLWNQICDMTPYLTNAGLAMAGVWFVLPYLPESPMWRLFWGLALYGFIFLPGPLIFKKNIYAYLISNRPFLKRAA